MKNAHRSRPELNAGSMADIAFLLLIFFLVTTTMATDVGLLRKLPEWTSETATTPVPERDVLVVLVNAAGDVMIDDVPLEISELPSQVYTFLGNHEKSEKKPRIKRVQPSNGLNAYSALASNGMVFLKFHPHVPYASYVAVQDAFKVGYKQLWNEVTQSASGLNFEDLDRSNAQEAQLIKLAKDAFPVRIAEEPFS